MPATNGINLATVEIDLITEINNSNGATMVINPSTLATLSTLQDYIKHEEKMNWMGTNGYGGLLQDAGTKKVGIAYYDKANKQMVVPTVENSLTYFEGSKFIPISDYQTAKKLENLYKVQQAKLYVHSEATGTARTTCNIVQKAGNVVTIVFDSGDALRYINDNTVIFSIPEGYRPKAFLSVNASQFNGTVGTIYIQPDGTAKWRGSTVTTASIIFSVSYII